MANPYAVKELKFMTVEQISCVQAERAHSEFSMQKPHCQLWPEYSHTPLLQMKEDNENENQGNKKKKKKPQFLPFLSAIPLSCCPSGVAEEIFQVIFGAIVCSHFPLN